MFVAPNVDKSQSERSYTGKTKRDHALHHEQKKQKNQMPERDIRFIAFSPRLVFCVKKILNDSSLSCAFDAISKIFELLALLFAFLCPLKYVYNTYK